MQQFAVGAAVFRFDLGRWQKGEVTLELFDWHVEQRLSANGQSVS
jgi:hypothetical protein